MSLKFHVVSPIQLMNTREDILRWAKDMTEYQFGNMCQDIQNIVDNKLTKVDSMREGYTFVALIDMRLPVGDPYGKQVTVFMYVPSGPIATTPHDVYEIFKGMINGDDGGVKQFICALLIPLGDAFTASIRNHLRASRENVIGLTNQHLSYGFIRNDDKNIGALSAYSTAALANMKTIVGDGHMSRDIFFASEPPKLDVIENPKRMVHYIAGGIQINPGLHEYLKRIQHLDQLTSLYRYTAMVMGHVLEVQAEHAKSNMPLPDRGMYIQRNVTRLNWEGLVGTLDSILIPLNVFGHYLAFTRIYDEQYWATAKHQVVGSIDDEKIQIDDSLAVVYPDDEQGYQMVYQDLKGKFSIVQITIDELIPTDQSIFAPESIVRLTGDLQEAIISALLAE